MPALEKILIFAQVLKVVGPNRGLRTHSTKHYPILRGLPQFFSFFPTKTARNPDLRSFILAASGVLLVSYPIISNFASGADSFLFLLDNSYIFLYSLQETPVQPAHALALLEVPSYTYAPSPCRYRWPYAI